MNTFEQNKLIFDRAFEKVKNPATWTQYKVAEDAYRTIVCPDSPDAVKWCSLGAILMVHITNPSIPDRNDFFEKMYRYFNSIITKNQNNSISYFNDHHSHAEVVKFWEDFGKKEGFYG